MRANALKSEKRLNGEDYLSSLLAVVLTLENGEKVRFNIARETRIPSDDKLRAAAKTAPARVAFWAYQTERALGEVRRKERQLAKTEGHAYKAWRIYITENLGLDVTEPMLRSSIDQDVEVAKARRALNAAREQHGILRAVRDAVEHRAWTVRGLVQRRED